MYKTPEKQLAYLREWKRKNPEKVREYEKRWKKKNPNYHKEYSKKWGERNKERLQKKGREYYRKLKETSPEKVEKYKECATKRAKLLKLDIKRKLSSKCIFCGSVKNLHIHHKDFSGGRTGNWHTLKSFDINKVILLCAKCHSRAHFNIIRQKEKLCLLCPIKSIIIKEMLQKNK